jgi:hypothetical protein
MLCKEITAVCTKNNKKHKFKIKSCRLLKHVEHIATTGLQKGWPKSEGRRLKSRAESRPYLLQFFFCHFSYSMQANSEIVI